ncbi:excisionase [Paraburkholderia sediminicola]|uniref:excisionase n=1 Tax=Paraburkholderia sediminicola TaxID=458836 RepID=UPI0038B77D30
MADTQPKLIPLEAWAKQVFGEYAPHRNTLYNWRRFGWIVPAPIKIGNRYFVEPTAVYADNNGEMARRHGSALR